MLARENILHQVEGPHIYAYGNRADEFANFIGGDTRRPMQSGVLNPTEPKNLQVIELLLGHLCGRAAEGEKLCVSIPSAPPDHGSDLVFHERSVKGIFEKLGYQVQSINEGLAVIYSELKDANFTGIGMSFGGGMCNICVAYLGLPVLTIATTKAGDYIDHSAASVTGETPTTVRLYKEHASESGFMLDVAADGSIDRALSVYYTDVIETAAAALQSAMANSKSCRASRRRSRSCSPAARRWRGTFLPRRNQSSPVFLCRLASGMSISPRTRSTLPPRVPSSALCSTCNQQALVMPAHRSRLGATPDA